MAAAKHIKPEVAVDEDGKLGGKQQPKANVQPVAAGRGRVLGGIEDEKGERPGGVPDAEVECLEGVGEEDVGGGGEGRTAV